MEPDHKERTIRTSTSRVGLPVTPLSRARLWDPRAEVDACGVGFVAQLSGEASHQVIEQGLEILVNLTHRGAAGADETTGDGAGILLQMPDEFFRSVASELGIRLPAPGEYGVGMIFLSRNARRRQRAERHLEKAIEDRGHKVLGWRDVPVDSAALGNHARRKEPAIRQIFVERAARFASMNPPDAREAFERDLFLTRKSAQNVIRESQELAIPRDFYAVSFSANTIVYKGLLLPWQMTRYFPDLLDTRMKSALALVHQRFSTNTFPEWDLAQPFRFMCHNGEINTLQGNVNWMIAREAKLASPLLGADVKHVAPVIRNNGSDSACFDNVLELLVQGGRSLPHSVAMMIPEAWEKDHRMTRERRGFYEYHATLMEPWDGPAVVAFTDGLRIGANLDRNGLRPARYIITRDGRMIFASEAGVLDIPDAEIVKKSRLKPGRMLLVDLEQKKVITDSKLKAELCSRRPYYDWVERNKITIERLPEAREVQASDAESVASLQRVFGYTQEDKRVVIGPMAASGQEPIGSMGVDIPLAILSEKPRLLYDYFYQHFAQVSNPPIDPIREEMVMSLVSLVGRERNLLDETPEHAHVLELPHPILTQSDLARIREAHSNGFDSETLDMLWPADRGTAGFQYALERLCESAAEAVRAGKSVLILSDRRADREHAPLPALLATAAVHHHLIRKGLRKDCGIVVESGEPREVHHIALLIGYGAHAVNPYGAFDTAHQMVRDDELAEPENPGSVDAATATKNLIQAYKKGLLKIFSKMGISTLQSYHGAQIFEAVGLDRAFLDRYFTGTPSRIGGASLEVIAEESRRRHEASFPKRFETPLALDWSGKFHWRAEGERHHWSPSAVAYLQRAVRENDRGAYEAFSREVSEEDEGLFTVRGLLEFNDRTRSPVPLDEVESVESILRRFKTGAMSFGSISAEAHETLAIAMNRIGGKSNTGEGGEDERRFIPDADGRLRRSAIKQVASGRFGVTANYLVNADEIQIKMAQGAKPGEGGQLPGHKVSVEIAATRHSIPGVGLISPPPHHDIYSIEDLAQLIFDLKNINPRARISVKLVAKVGVGTIAAGVAKAHADVIVIAGNSGGTGASPWSSIQHAGAPWELGLAEAHQVLVGNGLRSRVVVETDGGIRNGRDVVIAALLGAEEFAFATSALITMGCVLLRKCHLNTCSVGIATQRPDLREKFAGEPEHVERYFRFIAEEVRGYMARLGFRSMNEMIGQVQLLQAKRPLSNWKAAGLDLSDVLAPAPARKAKDHYCTRAQDHGLENQLDHELIATAKAAIEHQEPVRHEFGIRNRHRTVGAMLSHEVTRRYGSKGLPAGTIQYRFNGTAGQSFGAFLAPGIRFDLVGEANDYLGKGLSGGDIAVFPHEDVPFIPEQNIAVGNVTLYGATSGRVFIRGRAGERFCVRNSGAEAVVEGVGDHACEYMTGGRVVVLGATGRNFAAGMSGGIAYVLYDENEFERRCNKGMVELERLDSQADQAEVEVLKALITEHFTRTGSSVAEKVLADWERTLPRFIKVMPIDYKEALRTGSSHRKD